MSGLPWIALTQETMPPDSSGLATPVNCLGWFGEDFGRFVRFGEWGHYNGEKFPLSEITHWFAITPPAIAKTNPYLNLNGCVNCDGTGSVIYPEGLDNCGACKGTGQAQPVNINIPERDKSVCWCVEPGSKLCSACVERAQPAPVAEMVCPGCKGEQTFKHNVEVDNFATQSDSTPCGVCGGTGKVRKET